MEPLDQVQLDADAEPRGADVARIVAAIGDVPRVAYECPHVYPLSTPTFVKRPGAPRERPASGLLKLYVHVPFCNYACGFCFYAKRVGTPRAQMARYVRAVARELEWVEPGTLLDQLYVGGGTPTALPPDLLDALLAAVDARTRALPGASVAVESSPESISPAHVDVLRARRVNRVSMGIESLDPTVLAALDRRHGAEQALDACELLVAGGFVVNVDLIYGLPGQTEAGFRADLETVAARRPHSISLYNLRLNERTPLARVVDEIDRLDVPRLMRWRRVVNRTTADLGYVQRRWHMFVRRDGGESSFDRAPCVDGFGAGHQLGVGLSALSHLGDVIYRNHEGFEPYLTRIERGESPVDGVFALADQHDRRTLFIARTLGDGRALDRAEYARAFGRDVEHDFGAVLARLAGADLTRDDGARISLSESGRLVYDLVTLAFYPPRARGWLDERQRLA